MITESKIRYSSEELKEFDLILDAKIVKAQEQLDFYNSLIEDVRNQDLRYRGLDDASTAWENDNILNNINRIKKLIEHLNKAKLRIENGTYGICRETGKLISKDRLKASPHATLSIEAKRKQ